MENDNAKIKNKNKKKAGLRIKKLKKLINHHRYLYHVLDKQEIGDAPLDSLKHELKKIEDEYPELITSDSPTQRVGGAPLKGFKKKSHIMPMLSLEDIFNSEELSNWFKRTKKFLGDVRRPTIDLFVEKKFDGLALSVIYENGVLDRAVTRGNGKVGEDVTSNARTISSIPLTLELYQVLPSKISGKLNKVLEKGILEVRGEVLISKKEFERINKEQEKKNKPLYANSRNLAAGSIRQLDPRVVFSRKLDFVAYDIVGDIGQSFHSEEHMILSALGFKTDSDVQLSQKSDDILAIKKDMEKRRERLKYNIDGLVITVDSNELFKKLGVVGKAPRGSVALKFATLETTTKVKDIIIQVGRTGALTPVAVLEPINVGGVTISRATLHNEDEIIRLGLKINDTVIVGRAGDVIPDIKKVLKELRDGTEKSFKMPKNCPVCGRRVFREKLGAIHRCINRRCQARSLKLVYYFTSRQGLDIEGLGPKIIDALFDNNLIQDATDIFNLKEGDLIPLERFAEKSAENLIKAIEAKREVDLAKFIRILGILNVGEETSEDLALHFGNLDKLKEASLEELENIPNIGVVVARSIHEWFRDTHQKIFLNKLLKHVRIKSVKRVTLSKYKGLTFVLTGTLASVGRDEAKVKIRDLSGNISETVSKNTDFVVAGDSPGSKLDKAKKLGVKILNEKEFLKMIGGN